MHLAGLDASLVCGALTCTNMQEDCRLSYGPTGYEKRAEECVRLANLTDEEDVRRELLMLRQGYLRADQRLRRLATGRDDDGSVLDRPT